MSARGAKPRAGSKERPGRSAVRREREARVAALLAAAEGPVEVYIHNVGWRKV